MKNLAILFFSLAFYQFTFAQAVGVGTQTPDPSAMLDVSSTNKGMLVPRLTTTQRTTISNPATGLLVFDTNTNSFWFKGGTTWVELIDSSNTVVQTNGPNLYMGMTGNIGIGTDEPTSKLEIVTNIEDALTIKNELMELKLKLEAEKASIGTTTNHALSLYANNNTNQLTISPAGNVGINVNEAEKKLHVQGETYLNGNVGIGYLGGLYPLGFPAAFGNKISFNGAAGNHFGIGLAASMMQLYSDGPDSDIAFGIGHAGAFTERMRMKGTGRLGIGTPSPLQALHVIGNGILSGLFGLGGITSPLFPMHMAAGFGNKISLSGDPGSFYGFGVGASSMMQMITPVGGSIGFGTGNSDAFTEKMRISSEGKVGIGETEPNEGLEIGGSGRAFFGDGAGTTRKGLLIDGVETNGTKLEAYNYGTSTGIDLLLNPLGGHVGIGVSNSNAPLQFENSTVNRKIVLYESVANDDNQFYGFGVNGNTLRYQVGGTANSHVFFAGTSPTNSNELMRIKGDGNVGIGNIINPQNRLDVQVAARSNTHPTGLPLYVTGSQNDASPGVEIRNNDATQGIGFGRNTIYAAGSNTNQDLGLQAKGTSGNLLLKTNSAERMRITGNGNVGIGISSPNATLEITRGTGSDGTLMIRGTTQPSHFNYGTTEDTYIRGGKAESHVILNDQPGLGNVGIGTLAPVVPVQKLHVEGSAYVSNKIGIGVNSPNAPLHFATGIQPRKIVLDDAGNNNEHQFFGFGIGGGEMRYQVNNPADHVFYAGTSVPSSVELMRIKGTGNVDIAGDVEVGGNADIASNVEVHGNAIIDGNLEVNGSLLLGYEVVTQAVLIPFLSTITIDCLCPAGKKVLGGGLIGPDELIYKQSFPNLGGTGWHARVANPLPFDQPVALNVVCAKVGN